MKAIMTPAMIVSWVFGVWLGVMQGLWSELPVWFICKLVLVTAMSAVHFWLAGQIKIFAADANIRTGKFFRVMNEVPTLLLIGTVCFVVVKPFL